MHCNPYRPETWDDLNMYLPYLKQALLCCVCSNIINVPMGHIESSCLHVVCKACVGGKMKLKPSCSWCKDWDKFSENIELGIIVQCYKKLCQYLKSSAIFQYLSKDTVNGSTHNLISIIEEGSSLHSIKNKVNGSSDAVNKKRDSFDSSDVNDSIPPTLTPENIDKPDVPRTRHLSRKCNNSSGNTHYSFRDNIVTELRIDTNHTISQTVAAEHDYTCIKTNNDSPPIMDEIKKEFIEQHDCKRDTSSREKGRKRQRSGPNICFTNGNSDEFERYDKRSKPLKRGIMAGCRCGMATPNPGKLTCCGQRCPCYSMFKGCTTECKCRGCRNSRHVIEHPDDKNDTPAPQLYSEFTD